MIEACSTGTARHNFLFLNPTSKAVHIAQIKGRQIHKTHKFTDSSVYK